MNKLDRPAAPSVLVEHGAAWSAAFAELRARDPGARFRWRTHGGVPVNRLLIEILRSMTLGHCSYCDGYPVAAMSLETIDHFRPKSAFPELAYAWDNLFYACDCCQSAKGERFDAALLKPDEPGYDFDRYFQVNFRTGDVEPSAAAGAEDQVRARTTIELLELNRRVRSEARRRALRAFARLSAEERAAELSDFPYRFMLGELA